MNNALNANIPNITVSPFASGTFNMFVEDCNISINVIYKALPITVVLICPIWNGFAMLGDEKSITTALSCPKSLCP